MFGLIAFGLFLKRKKFRFRQNLGLQKSKRFKENYPAREKLACRLAGENDW